MGKEIKITNAEQSLKFYIIGINSFLKDYLLAAALNQQLRYSFQLYSPKREKEAPPIIPFSENDLPHAIYKTEVNKNKIVLVHNKPALSPALLPSLSVFEYLIICTLPSRYIKEIHEKISLMPEIFFSSILEQKQIDEASNRLADQLINSK